VKSGGDHGPVDQESLVKNSVRKPGVTFNPADPGTVSRMVTALGEIEVQLAAESNLRRSLEITCAAARHLAGAQYAAASVTVPGPVTETLVITSGLDAPTSAAVALKLPLGEVVRNLVRTRRACRLTSLSGNPLVMGLPPEHPPAHAFLGAPIILNQEACGWLCLTNKLGADAFGEEDEWIAGLLAAQLGRICETRDLRADARQTQLIFPARHSTTHASL
jgi:GAF domain-containing protein